MGIVKLSLSQKSQFDLVEKIKDKNKNRTPPSLFQSSEDGKQEKRFMWPKNSLRYARKTSKIANFCLPLVDKRPART